MAINLQRPDITELKPRICVFGVGGGGGNAVNNMINAGLNGVDFVVANTDAQALAMSKAERLIQLGAHVTEGLGAGSQPEVGRAAAEECYDEIVDHLNGVHMCFVTAGMGGGTGTGAAPIVARAAREKGILTVGVVTKPFHFEGKRRMSIANQGIDELQKCVDTLIVIPNQNLFRLANEKTTFADAFAMADQVLYSGVACITDLMVKEGLINLDFADVRSVMREMGKAMMGTGEASGEGRAMAAAEAAIANPLLDETSMHGAKGLLISITGGRDMTLFEVDEAATRIREEVDQDANIILGATFDEDLEGIIRVSVVATGIDRAASEVGPQDFAVGTGLPSRTSVSMADTRKAVQDPVAETIRRAEAGLRPAQAPQPAPQKQAAPADFQPASNLFTPPAQPQQPAPAAAVAAPEPAQQMQAQHAQQMQAQQAQQMHAQQMQAQQAQQMQAAAAVRMPRVEDFPPVVKAEIAARSAPQPQQEDRGPMGLLKRLTTGLSARREEEETASLQPARQPRQPVLREQPRLAPNDPQLYAPRQAQAPQPVNEEDQLEIPAFLRRQAN